MVPDFDRIISNTNFLFGNVPRIDKDLKKNININNLFVLIDMFYIELYNLYTKNNGVFFLNEIENYRQNIIYKLDKGKNSINDKYSINDKIKYCNYYNSKLRILFKIRGINFYGTQNFDDTKDENFFKKTILKLLFIYDYHNQDDYKEEKEEDVKVEEYVEVKEEEKENDNLEYIIQNNKSFNYINQYYNPYSISTLFLTKKILLNDTDNNELKNIVEHIDYPKNEELKFLENLGMHSNLAHFVFFELWVRVPTEVLYYKYDILQNNYNSFYLINYNNLLNKEMYDVIILYAKHFDLNLLKYINYEKYKEIKETNINMIYYYIDINRNIRLIHLYILNKNMDPMTFERFYPLLYLFLIYN